jgi:hypothetical protein
MTNTLSKLAIFSLAIAALSASLSASTEAVAAEFSRVTLFVEGMMKSRGGVT